MSDFIDDVYQSLFNRAPDAEGKSYWTGQISSGAVGFGAGILAIANGAMGSDATIILNKMQVALDFSMSTSAAGLPVTSTFLAVAVEVLDGVDETAASITAAGHGRASPKCGFDTFTLEICGPAGVSKARNDVLIETPPRYAAGIWPTGHRGLRGG